MRETDTTSDVLVLTSDDYVVLGEQQFGGPGLEAIEVVGPFVDVNVLGPLLTVHDSRIQPHLGIGHHPHRFNERIFYIMTGELDHSDALNDITGHMDTGDVGLFTEGQRGMLHSEWNNGDAETHAFILVYATDPVPPQASFDVLPDAEAPRYEEPGGARTKELVGPTSGLRIHGDIRLFTDSHLDSGARLVAKMSPGEGGLVSVQEGAAVLDGRTAPGGSTLLFPPADREREFAVQATEPSRLLRVVHGPGYGLRRRSVHGR